jgi:hypothetical protein
MNNGERPPGFKGVWINATLWSHPQLSWMEKCLVAEIDSLAKDGKPCTASCEHLAEMMHSSPKTVKDVLSRLQRFGVVKRLRFHRTFVDRVVSPEYSNKSQAIPSSLRENTNPSLSEITNPSKNTNPSLSDFTPQPSCFHDTDTIIESTSKNKSADASFPSPLAVTKTKTKAPKKEKAFQPPSLQEFIDYARTKGISEQDARDQFEIWEAADWHDGKGNQILSWKSKLLTFHKSGWLLSDKRSSASAHNPNQF